MSMSANLSLFGMVHFQNVCTETAMKHTLPIAGSSFCINKHGLAQGLFTVAQTLTNVPYATSFLYTDNSKFTFTLANGFISRPVVIYKF